MKLSGIRKFKPYHPDDAGQGPPLAEYAGTEPGYAWNGKGKIIIPMALHLFHAPVLGQFINLFNHLIHLVRHDPVIALIDDPASYLIGKGHAGNQENVRRILFHCRCK